MKYKILAILCIGFILWFTVQPVELHWRDTDIWLSAVVSAVSFVALLMLFKRKQQISLSFIDMTVGLWFVYVMLRAYVDYTYPCANFCLRAMQMLALYVGLRLLLSSVRVSEKMIVLGILLCGVYEVVYGVGQTIGGSSRHYLYALSGTFLNPGPYSAFLSMGLVMSCRFKKGFWLPVVFLILLPATWSRAAFLSAAICLGIIYWNQWKRWRWWVFAGVIVVMTGLYFLKQGSADGRSIIYLISILSISHHPIWGSGIGSFSHQYAEEMASFSLQNPFFNYQSADVTSSAYNCLLQIGVEQGLLGICLAVTLVALMLVRLNKMGKTLGIGLLSLLIFSMFSYPFDLLPYQIIFVLIAAYAGTGGEKNLASSTNSKKWSRSYFVPIALFGLVFLFSLFTHWQMTERAKAESDYRMMAGVTNAAFLDDYYELLPLLRSNERFLFDFSKILEKDGRYNDSNAMLRLGTLVSNDPMLYVIQGNNYSKMGFFEEAEQAYQKAFHMMPNRLYPLYQLMLLYEREGKTEEMYQMAWRVLRFNEKVVSPATKEMKWKAKKIEEKRNYGKLSLPK